MLNEQQFGKFKPKKPQGPTKPRKPKIPGQQASGGTGGYRFLPVPKSSREELDLIEAKARAINVRTRKAQLSG